LILIVTAAFWLRTTELDRRPMHADEANQAVKLGELLDTGHYTYDPRDHHGPTLYYLAVPFAWARGESSLAELTETTVRLLPALAGTAAVLLIALIAMTPGAIPSTSLGHFPGLVATAFLAVSPPSVYYSRYFIQETLLVAFTLAAFLCASRWWQRGGLGWTLGAGFSLGLMFATKATSIVLIFAAFAALLAIRPKRSASPHVKRDLSLAPGAAILTAVVFFSSFFTHFAGVRDAFAALSFASQRATGETGHEKPWWYYLHLLAWQREGGLVFHQLALSSLAVLGTILAFGRRHTSPLLRGAAIYTIVLFVALSFTPYKTPWHVIHFVPGLVVLAAGAIAAIPQWWLAAALAAFTVTIQIKQTQLVAYLRPADARNPYAYVHSSPDVTKVRALAQAALTTSPDAFVRVIGPEYWPLPWYLRGFDRVGYWSAPPEESDAALLIVHQDVVDAVRARLTGNYRESILGLRPGVLCIVFTRNP
jgi:uncharacterized protein (TIGR03663 family)